MARQLNMLQKDAGSTGEALHLPVGDSLSGSSMLPLNPTRERAQLDLSALCAHCSQQHHPLWMLRVDIPAPSQISEPCAASLLTHNCPLPSSRGFTRGCHGLTTARAARPRRGARPQRGHGQGRATGSSAEEICACTACVALTGCRAHS